MIKVLVNVIPVRVSSRFVDSWQLMVLPPGLSSGCGQGTAGRVSSLVSFLTRALILPDKGTYRYYLTEPEVLS